MGKKVTIEVDKRSTWWRDKDPGVTNHTKSEPLAMSPRNGLLVHRVRYRMTFARQRYSHDAVTYWCGNSCCSPIMLYDLPAGRMICARCEVQAASDAARSGRHNKRAADIVGHTVKLGKLVVVQVGVQKVKARK